jgi:hypothetical protein
MTNIKLTQKAGGHKAGATIEVTPKVAAQLIEYGRAEPVEDKPKRARGKASESATLENPESPLGGASPLDSEQTAG